VSAPWFYHDCIQDSSRIRPGFVQESDGVVLSLDLCRRLGNHAFLEYFERNWDSSRPMWVLHHRQDLPHFNTHTNNPLESFFWQVEANLDGKSSMVECIQEIIAHERRVEHEYDFFRSRLGQYRNQNYDNEMANILRFTTHHVATLIEPQYTMGLAKADTYVYKPEPKFVSDNGAIVDSDIVLVTGAKKIRRLNLDDYS
jgi:hypothetical protein